MQRFRPSTLDDAPQILALFAEAGLHPNSRPEDLSWKYWREREDYVDERSFVLADGTGRVIAHGSAIPGCLAGEDRRLRVIHVIDWAALPQSLGAGVSLMRQIRRHADALISVGGSEVTRRILPVIGFDPLCEITGYVRPLHPLRILAERARGGWRRLPRLARSLLWRLTAPSPNAPQWRARRIGPEELHSLASVFPRPRGGAAVMERSEALYRFILQCPIVETELYGLERSGGMHGYFLLTFAQGQVRLADLWMDSQDPEDWRALILHAVQQAMHRRDAAELVAWASTPELSRRFLECGFHPRNSWPVSVLCASADTPPSLVHLQMLDTDAAFHHHGRVELWS